MDLYERKTRANRAIKQYLRNGWKKELIDYKIMSEFGLSSKFVDDTIEGIQLEQEETEKNHQKIMDDQITPGKIDELEDL